MSDMNDFSSTNKRREALRKLAIAGGVLGAAKWSKPVVDRVILPAHAQTTDPLRDPCFLTIIPQTATTYLVQVAGVVVDSNGNGIGGIEVNVTVTTGGQSANGSDTTDAGGNYLVTNLGPPFDVCIDSSDPVATVSSPDFVDIATCFEPAGKECLRG